MRGVYNKVTDNKLMDEAIDEDFDKLYIDLSNLGDCDFLILLRNKIFYSNKA